MSDVIASYRACGKVILLGEHFVVHGAPALALPLAAVGTEVRIEAASQGPPGCRLVPPVGLPAADADRSRLLVQVAVRRLALRPSVAWEVHVASEIPVGHGLGSSAAFSVALVGALIRAAGAEPTAEQLKLQAHALEREVHGNPSGVDDAVVSSRQPVWFIKGGEVELLAPVSRPALVLASSGEAGSTRRAVASVRARMAQDPAAFERLRDQAEALAGQGRQALMAGDWAGLGPVLNQNHALLQQVGVSTDQLDRLVTAARSAGALGAKLTGAGQGGFVLALVSGQDQRRAVARALGEAGAALVLHEGEELATSS